MHPSSLSRFLNQLAPWVVHLGLFLKSPSITRWGFLLGVRFIKSSGRFTVLCLGKSAFNDDVMALAHFGQELSYQLIPAIFFRYIYEAVGPASLDHVNYHTDKNHEEKKKCYYAFLKRLFLPLRNTLKFDAVLAGNFVYMHQQELATLCVNEKIPFLALHKESIAVPGTYDNYAKFYENRQFIGDRILFYNEPIRQALLRANIGGMSEANTQTVGVPRFDFYFVQKEKQNRDVVFFSFFPWDKIHYYVKDPKIFTEIEKRSEQFHVQLMRFAQNNPLTPVIIKTKAASKYLEYVQTISKKQGVKKPSNLTLTNRGKPEKMILNAKAVIGFNSNTLLEALIAGKKVMSPYFGDLFPGQAWDYFQDYADLLFYLKQEGDLENALQDDVPCPGSSERKKEFLSLLVGEPDGNASLRTEQAILGLFKN